MRLTTPLRKWIQWLDPKIRVLTKRVHCFLYYSGRNKCDQKILGYPVTGWYGSKNKRKARCQITLSTRMHRVVETMRFTKHRDHPVQALGTRHRRIKWSWVGTHSATERLRRQNPWGTLRRMAVTTVHALAILDDSDAEQGCLEGEVLILERSGGSLCTRRQRT